MHPAPITNLRGFLPFVYAVQSGTRYRSSGFTRYLVPQLWFYPVPGTAALVYPVPGTAVLVLTSIDIDRSPNGDHVVQLLDVLIFEAYAAMAYRAPDCLRGIGSMNAVPVAKDQPPRSKHTLVTSLIHSVRRNENVAVGNYLTPVVRLERNRMTVGKLLYDF